MQIRLLALFLLGLFLGNILLGSFAEARELTAKEYRTLFVNSYQRAGVYHLTDGTQGCPTELTWKNDTACQGFQLIYTKKGRVTENSPRYMFCSINKGSALKTYKVSSWEKYLVRATTTWKENVIHKIQNTDHSVNDAVVSKRGEESLILDQEAFVFDRSVQGQGWSCLYKKY